MKPMLVTEGPDVAAPSPRDCQGVSAAPERTVAAAACYMQRFTRRKRYCSFRPNPL